MENTVEKTLNSLLKLQKIDSEIDNILKIRGDLPEEVEDLEDEIIGLETRQKNIDDEISNLETDITDMKTSIKDATKLIKKYEEQQMNVRNNREYDAITKEMELQALEIQISEKRIKEAYIKIESKKEEIEGTKVLVSERTKDLDSKQKELEIIICVHFIPNQIN